MKLLKPVLALLLSLGISALVLECGVRSLMGEQVKFPRHVVGAEFGVRTNQPNSHYRHRSPDVEVWFEINSRGLRADREYPYAKPPGTVRIVSLGDSFTAGYEVDYDQTFSQVIERELSRAGLEVEVLNAGVSGYSNAEALLYLERELFRYDPDLVMLSFFGNDLSDNIRSQLFALENGELIQTADSYVPAGGLGNFLNTNPIFNWLSGYSDAFALIKERLTRVIKRRAVRDNLKLVAAAETTAGSRPEPAEPRDAADEAAAIQEAAAAASGERVEYQRRLAAAILDRIYALTQQRGIPMVLQSIPTRVRNPERLVEMFPVEHFEVDREGLLVFHAKRVLDPWVERELLYYHRSHGHWTPRAHEVAGRELSQLILEAGWLGSGERSRVATAP